MYRNRVNNMKLQIKLLMSFAVCAVPIWASSSSSSSNSKVPDKVKKELESSSSSSSSSASSAAAAVVSANPTQSLHTMFSAYTENNAVVVNSLSQGCVSMLEGALKAGANVNFANRITDAGYAGTVLSSIYFWSRDELEGKLKVLIAFNVDPFIRKPNREIVDFAFTQLYGRKAVKALAMLKEHSLKFCKDNKLEHECKDLLEKHYEEYQSKK